MVNSLQRQENRGSGVPQLVGTGFTTQVLPLALPDDASPRLTPPLLLAWLPFGDNQHRRGCSLANSQLSAQWTRAMRREQAGEPRKASRGDDSSDKTRGQSRTSSTTHTHSVGSSQEVSHHPSTGGLTDSLSPRLTAQLSSIMPLSLCHQLLLAGWFLSC